MVYFFSFLDTFNIGRSCESAEELVNLSSTFLKNGSVEAQEKGRQLGYISQVACMGNLPEQPGRYIFTSFPGAMLTQAEAIYCPP